MGLSPAQVAAVLIPTLILAAVAWTTYARVLRTAEQELARTATLLSGPMRRMLQSANVLLQEIDREAAGLSSEEIAASEPLQRRLSSVRGGLSYVPSIGIVDEQGRLLVSSTPASDRSLAVADREFFQIHRDAERGLYIGTPVTGRLSRRTVVPLTRRLSGEGSFRGVAFVTVEPGSLLDLPGAASASVTDEIAVLRQDGAVLAVIGGDLTVDAPVAQAVLHLPRDAPAGVTQVIAWPDPRRWFDQLTAVHPVSGWPVAVAVTRAKSSFLRPWALDMSVLALLFLAAKAGLVAAIRVAERRARALAQANERLQATMDALTAHVAIVRSDGVISAVNTAWWRFARDNGGRDEACGVGASYLAACLHDEAGAGPGDPITDGLRAVLTGRQPQFQAIYHCGRAETGPRWFRLTATPLPGRDAGVVIAHEDVTELKRSEGVLRDMTGQLLRRQDEERRRIARDLHDSTAQNLLGAVLEIKLAADAIRDETPDAADALARARSLVEASQTELRTLAYLLHPPMLDEAGLPNALRWFVEGFQRRTGVSVDVAIDRRLEERRLPSEAEVALFRVAQEALTNVHRHAGVRTAQLRLSGPAGDDTVDLVVQDDGTGFLRSERPAREGVGLSGMRERLRILGGELVVESGPGGTRLRASVRVST